jgi:hypothetical protein
VPKRFFKALFLGLGLLAANVAGARTIVFQEGAALPAGVAYVGTQDTEIEAVDPSTSFGSKVSVRTDLDYLGAETQGLLRFDGIFGALPNQIPLGSTITSAVLTLEVFNSSNVPVGIISVYRMITAWDESSTWNSLVGGVQVGSETAAVADDAHTTEQIASTTFNVLPSLQAWAAGATNLGWVFLNSTTDGMEFWSSEHGTLALRPKLTVTFVPPATPHAVPALSRHGLVALLAALTLIGAAAIPTSRRRRTAARTPSTPS